MVFLSLETWLIGQSRVAIRDLRWQQLLCYCGPFVHHSVLCVSFELMDTQWSWFDHKIYLYLYHGSPSPLYCVKKPLSITYFLIKAAYFPHPNGSFDNTLQNIIPQWLGRCYHLVLSKQAPRLACFHSSHVHHLLLEACPAEPQGWGETKNPDQKQAFPLTRLKPKCACCDSRVHLNFPSICIRKNGSKNAFCWRSDMVRLFYKVLPKYKKIKKLVFRINVYCYY